MSRHTVRQAFLTGGSGFVGGHVAQALLKAGVHVRALVRNPARPGNLAGLEVDVVEGDLAQPGDWLAQLRGCDTLFHVAALYSHHAADAARLYAVNVGGTQTLLKAAAEAGVTRFIHTSTVGTIGRPAGAAPATEETPFNLWADASDYVRSKWLGEAAALWWHGRGLPVVVVHPTAPVGPGDWKPTATGRRIADFLAGRRPDFPAGGMNICPVVDMAAGHLLAAQQGRPGRRYILGHAAGNLDEAAFLQLLAQVSGLPIPPSAVAPRRGRRPLALTADPSRAIAELALPQSDLRTALAAAVTYFLEKATES